MLDDSGNLSLVVIYERDSCLSKRVARRSAYRFMKIDEAKKYVAAKLSVSVSDLTDPVVMSEVREDLEVGSISPLPGCNKGIYAKLRIAEVLDIEINCVRRLKDKGLV